MRGPFFWRTYFCPCGAFSLATLWRMKDDECEFLVSKIQHKSHFTWSFNKPFSFASNTCNRFVLLNRFIWLFDVIFESCKTLNEKKTWQWRSHSNVILTQTDHNNCQISEDQTFSYKRRNSRRCWKLSIFHSFQHILKIFKIQCSKRRQNRREFENFVTEGRF